MANKAHLSDKTVIRAKSRGFDLDIRELWRYRDLVFLFVKRNYVVQYKQTLLGPFWLVGGPLVSGLVYAVVFGQFAGLSTDGVPQYLFYMAGTSLWSLFSNCATATSNTFLANSSVMGKIYFPRLTVPISQALTGLVSFGIQFVLMCLIMGVYAFSGTVFDLGWQLLLIPVVLVHCLLLGIAIGLIVAALTVKYRDLMMAVNYGLSLLMYATPVIYPISTTGGVMRILLTLNPVTPLIENFRYALFGSGTFMVASWGLSSLITVALVFVGLVLFGRSEKTFLDTI